MLPIKNPNLIVIWVFILLICITYGLSDACRIKVKYIPSNEKKLPTNLKQIACNHYKIQLHVLKSRNALLDS